MGQVIVGFDIEWKTTFTKVCLLVVFINVLDGGNYKINWTSLILWKLFHFNY